MKQVKKEHVITSIIVAVLLTGGFYYIGYQSGKNSVTSQYANNMGGSGRGGFGGMRGGANGANGSVIAKDDTSITVQTKDGSSKIVLYSPSTQVMKSTAGSTSDVSVGSQVIVQGKANTDGSITAQTISIRPTMPKPAGQ